MERLQKKAKQKAGTMHYGVLFVNLFELVDTRIVNEASL